MFFIGVILLSGCFTSIKSIKKKPDDYQGKKVMIRGKVVSSLDLLGINCFTVKGRTGYMLVVTDNLLPLKEDRIWVRGTVEKEYKYSKRVFLVIIEKKKKAPKPEKPKKIKDKT